MKPSPPQKQFRVAVALQTFFFAANDIMAGMARYNSREGRFLFRDLIFDDAAEIPPKLQRMRFDGAITSIASPEFQKIHKQLRAGLPIVNIGADSLGPRIPGICADDALMAELAIRHLREAGYERFAFVGRQGSPGSTRRSELLRARLPELALCNLVWPEQSEGHEPESNPALERWLAKLQPPVGIIVWFGHFARSVCLACEKLGLAVPADVGVLSLLDEHWCIESSPTISATRVAGEKMGYEAMKQLAALLQGRKPTAEMIQIAPRDIIARESTTKLEEDREHIQLAIDYIEANACKGITVKEVLNATRPGSRSKFYDDFTKQVGRSPAEYIRRMKIAKAKELLAESTLTIARISAICGFKEPAQFSETFRLETDTTPSAFRKKTIRK